MSCYEHCVKKQSAIVYYITYQIFGETHVSYCDVIFAW
jgi:hypothetical protein